MAEVKAAVMAEKATREQIMTVNLAMSECKKYSKMIGTSRKKQPTVVTRTRITRRILVGLIDTKSSFSRS